MKTNPKFIFFTDFDGTITLFDSEYFFLLYTCCTIVAIILSTTLVMIRGRALEFSCRRFQHTSQYHIEEIQDIFRTDINTPLLAT